MIWNNKIYFLVAMPNTIYYPLYNFCNPSWSIQYNRQAIFTIREKLKGRFDPIVQPEHDRTDNGYGISL